MSTFVEPHHKSWPKLFASSLAGKSEAVKTAKIFGEVVIKRDEVFSPRIILKAKAEL